MFPVYESNDRALSDIVKHFQISPGSAWTFSADLEFLAEMLSKEKAKKRECSFKTVCSPVLTLPIFDVEFSPGSFP